MSNFTFLFFMFYIFLKRKGNAVEKSCGHKSATVTLQNGREIQPINFGLPTSFFSGTFKQFFFHKREVLDYFIFSGKTYFISCKFCLTICNWRHREESLSFWNFGLSLGLFTNTKQIVFCLAIHRTGMISQCSSPTLTLYFLLN